MRIVCLQGLIGSGKDTVGGVLLEKYGGISLSFAGVLKDVVSVMFGWDRSLLEGSTEESREWREKVDEWWSNKLNIPHLTPRFVLQYIGTDVMRGSFHPDIWLVCLERKIIELKSSLKENELIVITDCRFGNEIECMRKMGAIFIRVIRGDEPEWLVDFLQFGVTPSVHNVHISEWGWVKNEFNHIIHNDGSLKDLSEKVNELVLFDKTECDTLESNLIGF